MSPARYVALPLLICFGHLSAQDCESRRTQAGDSTIDLAPPSGFIEVCSLDAQLCNTLTAGFPPSVKTLGYFVATADWDAFRTKTATGFNHYLIAQLALSMTPDRLEGFKTYLRSQQGNIPDQTELPRHLAAEGRAPLGILGETPSSISFGTIMTVRSLTGPTAVPTTMVATNTAAVVKTRVLSLYVYQIYRSDADIDGAKATTATWLRCMAKAN